MLMISSVLRDKNAKNGHLKLMIRLRSKCPYFCGNKILFKVVRLWIVPFLNIGSIRSAISAQRNRKSYKIRSFRHKSDLQSRLKITAFLCSNATSPAKHTNIAQIFNSTFGSAYDSKIPMGCRTHILRKLTIREI